MPQVVSAGTGPRLLFIHGGGVDHTTWSIQLGSSLRGRFTLVAYDRASRATVEEAAVDAAAFLGERTLVVGSSFGAVVGLELARSRPDLIVGAVLIEPPLAASDDPAAAPAAFLAEFDRRAAEQGGLAAGTFFLRTVLGDDAFERIPASYRERAASRWTEIRADTAALAAYRPRYRELAGLRTPVQLVGGERSSGYFRSTLDALAAALPDARLAILAGASHMLHAEAPRAFAELLVGFARTIGHISDA